VNTTKYNHISDQELLEKFYSDGNNEWLGILLQRYTLLLLGTCMNYLKNEEAAKDAVQQIFLKAVTELQKYKVDYFKSWLYMVAKNHCLMQLRDKNTFIPVEHTNGLIQEEADMIEQRAENMCNFILSSKKELRRNCRTDRKYFTANKKSYSKREEEFENFG